MVRTMRNKVGRQQWKKWNQEVILECIVYGRNRYTLKAFGWLALDALIGIRIALLLECILIHSWCAI
jgi:hypothetical protein